MADSHYPMNLQDNYKRFSKLLVRDIEALEYMIDQDLFEKGIVRIGAEQEFSLIDLNFIPSAKAVEILAEINDAHFTNEIGLYNLEINLDPLTLEGDCFLLMQRQLEELMSKATHAAGRFDNRVMLAGIIPTISTKELDLSYMTPNPRYAALNDRMRNARGNPFELHLQGVDELIVKHGSIMFEACNNSFQLHLQIEAPDFVSSYNWAQAIAGPILSVCTNSPLLLGRELWAETRIGLFQQSVDTRNSSSILRDQMPRVGFGTEWLENSVTEIFKDDLARFQILLTDDISEDSIETLRRGKIPQLGALRLFNSTVYRWNRPCYGTGSGQPHLRIENRYLPAGPTLEDEMANLAFWVGVMKGRPEYGDRIAYRMDFRDAKCNFMKAARYGKQALLVWNGSLIPAPELIKKVFLPIAYHGLQKADIDSAIMDHYLGIIAHRLDHASGSEWQIKNFRKLTNYQQRGPALVSLTRKMFEYQQDPTFPVSQWPEIDPAAILPFIQSYRYVDQLMITDVFRVKAFDLAELVICIMRWKKIYHVPVEDENGKLCGLLCWTDVQQFLGNDELSKLDTVANLMIEEVICVPPDLDIYDAIQLMAEKEIGCLPVVVDNEVVGMVTRAGIKQYLATKI